jgi:hypothetical protein
VVSKTAHRRRARRDNLSAALGAGRRRRYITVMKSVFMILAVLSLLAVVVVLLVGVFAMAHGGEFNRKYGNILMRARVGTQAFALLMLFLWAVS